MKYWKLIIILILISTKSFGQNSGVSFLNNVAFNFDLIENADMWICNAGVRHSETCATHDGVKVCGVYDQDIYVVRSAPYEAGSGGTSSIEDGNWSVEAKVSGKNKFSEVDPTGRTIISNFQVNLGSDLYGTKFFVEMCYVGKDETYAGMLDTFTYEMQSFGGGNYVIDAGLKVQHYVYCVYENGTQDIYDKTNAQNIVPSSSLFTDTYVTSNDKIRYCRLRFDFRETNDLGLRQEENLSGIDNLSIYGNVSEDLTTP